MVFFYIKSKINFRNWMWDRGSQNVGGGVGKGEEQNNFYIQCKRLIKNVSSLDFH
jgi:hypothetical protein